MSSGNLIYSIPAVPPSLNQFLGRNNVWEYRAAKNEWRQLVTACCRPAPAKPLERAHIHIELTFPDRRRRDADNYYKMILDGLVAAGIIQDDDFEHITTSSAGRCLRGERKTTILITEGKNEQHYTDGPAGSDAGAEDH